MDLIYSLMKHIEIAQHKLGTLENWELLLHQPLLVDQITDGVSLQILASEALVLLYINGLEANAHKYGYVNPPWAKPGGSKPEAWHWEYARKV